MANSGVKAAGYVAAEVMARAGVRRLYTVPGGNSAATIPASTPASRRQIATVSPITPHPATTASTRARVTSSTRQTHYMSWRVLVRPLRRARV